MDEGLKIRRVVTGHDGMGRSKAVIDEVSGNVISKRQKHTSSVIWTTGEAPADNSGNGDNALRAVGSTDPVGSVFRIVKYDPGVAPRNHRTESIDYAVVMSGEIDMILDEGEVHLAQGDVLVQRGTVHNWVNRGSEPCVIAFVLIAARPVKIEGVELVAEG